MMESNSEIKFLKNCELDKKKWDWCIENANNSLIYGFSFYLDSMAKNWDALVLNDYEAVMPLTWNKKFGISYLYQPAFTQQLGIFSTNKLAQTIQNNFLQISQQHFRFGEICINYENDIYKNGNRNNFILNLNKSYEEIFNNYSSDLLKNLRRTEKHKLQYSKSNDFEKAIELFKQNYSTRILNLKNESYNRFKLLCKNLFDKKMLLVRKVTNQNNELLSISIFLKDQKRIYLILSATTSEGRANDAQHFLIDNLIQEFANSPFSLDFEGSSISSIAYFNQRFGAINQPYFFVKWNNLAWPLKFLK